MCRCISGMVGKTEVISEPGIIGSGMARQMTSWTTLPGTYSEKRPSHVCVGEFTNQRLEGRNTQESSIQDTVCSQRIQTRYSYT